MAEGTMLEVVQRLRAENSEAMLDLLEFDYALDEFLRGLGLLAVASRRLHLKAQSLDLSAGDKAFERIAAVQEQAGRLSACMAQSLGAFREVCAGVASWRIADARGSATWPGAGSGSVPVGES